MDAAFATELSYSQQKQVEGLGSYSMHKSMVTLHFELLAKMHLPSYPQKYCDFNYC